MKAKTRRTRTEGIFVRVTADERASIDAAAKDANLRVGAWVLQTLLSRAELASEVRRAKRLSRAAHLKKAGSK